MTISWRLSVAFCMILGTSLLGCSSQVSDEAALDQIREAERIEAEEEGGMDEDAYEAQLDAEE